jgi:ferredoxin-NADP reductase
MPTNNNQLYTVVKVEKITDDITTITFTDATGKRPSYIAGQYINVFFPDSGTPEGKAYTISSAPSENIFCLSVKGIGEFSYRLNSLKIGDTVLGSLPYGYFYSESTDAPLVMVAGGISVTPFRSMIIESLFKNPGRTLYLFLSARTADGLIFREEFNALAAKYPTLKVFYYVTRETSIDSSITKRRITCCEIISRTQASSDTEFMICGSISFTRDMWQGLKQQKVPEEMIYTEAFFSH